MELAFLAGGEESALQWAWKGYVSICPECPFLPAQGFVTKGRPTKSCGEEMMCPVYLK